MSYSGGHSISNSFSLVFKNLRSIRSSIDLFELGDNGENVPINTLYQYNKTTLGSQFSVEVLTDGSFLITSNLVWDLVFTARLNESDSWISTTYTTTNGESLEDVNTGLNAQIHSVFGFTMYAQIQYLGDGNYPPTFLISTIITDKKVQQVRGRVRDLQFDTQAINRQLDFLPNNMSFQYISKSFVQIEGGNGTPYQDILESQNGSVLDMQTLSFDVLTRESALAGGGTFTYPTNPQSQLMECITFAKRDVNGNFVEYNKCPVMDAYQYQDSIQFLDMETEADTFALDGTTKVSYGMEATANVRFSATYTQITNLVANTPYAQQVIAEQEEMSDKMKSEGAVGRNYEADIPIPPTTTSSSEIKKKRQTLYTNQNLYHATICGYWGEWYCLLCY